jgi:NADPH:quinone reductase-like Zn-dependent oxidoreductase
VLAIAVIVDSLARRSRASHGRACQTQGDHFVMTNQLQGKVAAITGAASGIGLACAKTLLGLDATVVLVDRAEDRLNQLCAELGPKAIPVVVDLLDKDSVAGMMPQILSPRPAGSTSSTPTPAPMSAVR